MANADAWDAGFGIGKNAALKNKKPGQSSGIFTKSIDPAPSAKPASYKKGGKVKKTGKALVHIRQKSLCLS